MTTPDTNVLRAIPLDVLRQWYQDRVELTSIRSVSKLSGVGRTTLHKFVAELTTPHPRVRRLLALHYVLQQDDVGDDDALIREARTAFQAAASYFPEEYRERLILNILAFGEQAFAETGQEVPNWLRVLRVP